MVHYRKLYLYLLAGAGVTISTVKAKTQDPSFNCLGGPAFGLNAACDFNNFGNLSSHAPSEILYEIVHQANLPNDTFYPNGSHVTCLFKNKNFILDFGGSVGGMGVEIGVNFDLENPGTVCVYPDDVPQGGLTLGEIRSLSRAMIDKCSKCGRMSVNWLSKNESQLGWLKFNWKDPATCQDNCIDPEKNLTPVSTVNSNAAATSSSAAERYIGSPVLVLDRAMASTVVLWVFSFLFGVAAMVI